MTRTELPVIFYDFDILFPTVQYFYFCVSFIYYSMYVHFTFRLLQSSVASRACKYGIELCSEEAKVIFNDWKKDPDNYM